LQAFQAGTREQLFVGLGRLEERRLGIEALRELEEEWRDRPGRALETYCHTVLNSAAFVYVD